LSWTWLCNPLAVRAGAASAGHPVLLWLLVSPASPQAIPWRLKAAKMAAACGVPLFRLPSSSSAARMRVNRVVAPHPLASGSAQVYMLPPDPGRERYQSRSVSCQAVAWSSPEAGKSRVARSQIVSPAT
jgi:hypothetical protein